MALSVEQFVTEVKSMTVLELNSLVKALETEFARKNDLIAQLENLAATHDRIVLNLGKSVVNKLPDVDKRGRVKTLEGKANVAAAVERLKSLTIDLKGLHQRIQLQVAAKIGLLVDGATAAVLTDAGKHDAALRLLRRHLGDCWAVAPK